MIEILRSHSKTIHPAFGLPAGGQGKVGTTSSKEEPLLAAEVFFPGEIGRWLEGTVFLSNYRIFLRRLNRQGIDWTTQQKNQFIHFFLPKFADAAYHHYPPDFGNPGPEGVSFDFNATIRFRYAREAINIIINSILMMEGRGYSYEQQFEFHTQLAAKTGYEIAFAEKFVTLVFGNTSPAQTEEAHQKIFALLDCLTDYNRKRVLELFEEHWEQLADIGPRYFMDHLNLWLTLFKRWPKQGLTLLENLFSGIINGTVDIDIARQREEILAFIEKTHSFNMFLFTAYKKEGEAVLEKVRFYTDKIIRDELSTEEALQIVADYEAYEGWEFLLAIVQMVSPTSGASFVRQAEQIGLLKKMLALGDLRAHIPAAWRGQLKTFVLNRGEWRPKEGEGIDPDKEIRNLLMQFRAGEKNKISEVKLIETFKEYLQTDQNDTAKEKLRSTLFAYAGSEDALREKIDRIQDNDYAALDLLDQLFRDKDNLTVLIKNILGKIPAAYFTAKGKREDTAAKLPIEGDGDKLARALRRTWNQPDIPEAKRLMALGNILGKYERADITTKILNRVDIQGTDLAGAILTALEEGATLSKHEIAEAILSKPLRLIEGEKTKFEYRAAKPMQVGLRAVKGPTYGMYGLSAGVCTATDRALWQNPDFKLFAITDEEEKQVVGYIHVVETTINGKKYLTLPGINPSGEFMATVDAEKLYNGLMAAIIEYAREAGFAGVYIPTSPIIHSNRSGFQKVIQKKGYRSIVIPTVHWNTLPSRYPFASVFVVWEE
ncbi:MAG: hypothetical protein Q7T03_01080 [Deltaproteobacteria bacterium]|nr:hypothetical protein [Deltaproteobacteria bacterium]